MSLRTVIMRLSSFAFLCSIFALGIVPVTANAAGPYAITVTSMTHGKVSAVVKTTSTNVTVRSDAASTTLNESITSVQTITLTFIPDTGYQLSSFLDNGVSKSTPTYVISNPTIIHSITSVSFTQLSFQVTPSASTGGTISPSTPQTVAYGGSATFTMTPTTGYQLSSILVNSQTVTGTSSGASTVYTVQNVTSSSVIAVTFTINTYTVTTSAGAHGSIAGNGTSNTMNYGDTQTYTITPATNYHIATLTLDGQATTSPITISNIAANHAINATFAIDTYSTVVTQPSHGSITPSGTVTSDSQSDQALTVTSDYGYHIASVTSDGVTSTISNNASSYIKHFNPLSAAHTFTATMALNTYAITITVGANGSASETSHQANHGSTETVTFTPNNHYRISSVTLDGSAWVAPYVLTNITSAHSISVNFEQTPELTLYSFSPVIFGVGDVVTIFGSSLDLASDVRLNGTSLSSFTLVDAGTITFTVPSGTTNGVVSLIGPNGAVNSTQSYTYLMTTVSTSSTCSTSSGANSIAISAGRCVSPAASTNIPAPVITSMSASSVVTGGSLVIKGANFSGIRSIFVGNSQVVAFTLNSTSQITIKIPTSAAKNQNLRVTINGSPATSSGPPQTVTSTGFVRVTA